MSSIQPLGGEGTPTYETSSEFQSLSPALQLVLLQSFTTTELNADFPTVPLSPPSEFGDVNSKTYFDAVSQASMEFSKQLAASDYIDQGKRGIANQAAVLMALSLSDLFTLQANQKKADADQAQQEVSALSNQLIIMQSDASNQQTSISSLNSGNTTEQSELQSITNAYNLYISQLNTIGTFNADGTTFNIGSGNQTQYNTYTSAYQVAVSNFNSYLSSRKGEIAGFNSTTTSYNTSANQNNSALQNLISSYNLSSALSSAGITTAQLTQPTSTTRTDPYPSFVFTSSLVSGTTSTATIPALPAEIAAVSGHIPVIPSLSFTAPDLSSLKGIIQQELDNQNLGAINATIQTKTGFVGFLLMLQIFFKDTSNVKDPLLNFKPITSKVLPNSLTSPTSPNQAASPQGGGTLAAQSAWQTNRHIQGILGLAGFSQTIHNARISKSQTQKQAAVQDLLLLSNTLLSANSAQALSSILGTILGNVGALPLDSATYSALFGISYFNRIQELITSGLSRAALQTFAKNSPNLQGLTATDLDTLTAVLNLGLLLASAKLLTSTFNASDVLQGSLLPLLGQAESQSVSSKVVKENTAAQTQLQEALSHTLSQQGIEEDAVQFATQFAAQLASSLATASTLASITSDNLNRQVLADSLTASLILSQSSGTPVVQTTSSASTNSASSDTSDTTTEDDDQAIGDAIETADVEDDVVASDVQAQDLQARGVLAQDLSSEIVERGAVASSGSQATQESSSSSSVQPFNLTRATLIARQVVEEVLTRDTTRAVVTSSTLRKNLEESLRDAGVNSQAALQAAQEAILVQSDQTRRAIFDQSLGTISQEKLAIWASGHLDAAYAKQLSLEFAKSIFGPPEFTVTAKDAIRSPGSLINLVKAQLEDLKATTNRDYAESVSDAFKNTLLTTTDLNAFILKLMDPANKLIYSMNTGLMYGTDHSSGVKASIDIIV